MIIVNNREYEWYQGMTVASLLDILKTIERFEYIISNSTVVIINDQRIALENYHNHLICDDDCILMYPVVLGG